MTRNVNFDLSAAPLPEIEIPLFSMERLKPRPGFGLFRGAGAFALSIQKGTESKTETRRRRDEDH